MSDRQLARVRFMNASPRGVIRSAFAALLVSALVAPFAPAEAAKLVSKSKAKAARTAPAPKKAAAASARRGGPTLGSRERLALPASKALKPDVPKNLGAVKPPRSGDFYEGGSKEVEYEKLVDQEIKTLYKLSQQNKRSPNRGEIWLRLGERYVEKARLVEFRSQAEYDKKLKEYFDKKTAIKPHIENKLSREYNQRAVQLYEWFVKDFPKDPKVDQALFFLGYNRFELGDTKQGEAYYTDLVKRFPRSAYVIESHFALGEFYFENEQWQQAYDQYERVVQAKKARLNAFALYKSAWCLYRLNRVPAALKNLERVVRLSRASTGAENVSGRRAVNKVRLASEALKDYPPFYAEAGEAENAVTEFARIAGDEKTTLQMLEKLAFIYADTGNRAGANYIFKQLISMQPTAERSAEYQYQVVLAYATSDQKEFRKELDVWLESFGPESYWAKENAKNATLVGDVAKLQEATLRNHVLQLHQTAQNSRAPYSQQIAQAAYTQYVKYFPNSAQIAEMQFFHAELLFDMAKYEDAAKLYEWVTEKDPKGPYGEKAIVNALLAYEKDLPTAQAIEAKRGSSIEKMPLDPPVERFEKAAVRYIQVFPKGEKISDIQRRLGVLYYNYNHFEEAIDVFEKVIQANPKSENAEIAGNLILDIYKLKGDIPGFVERGEQLLANPAVASTKFGGQVKGLMEKARYKVAEKLEGTDPLKAAKEFESFAGAYKTSELVTAARYKAAENYEKGGDFGSALRMHNFVLGALATNDKLKAVQNDSRNALARLYQQTGQLELAAKQYQAYAQANPKDQKAINAYFNAGVLWDALGATSEATRNYQTYTDLSKRADRFEVVFSQAEMFRRQGSISRAFSLYDQYLKAGPRSEANAIASAYWLAAIAKQQGKAGVAKQWFQKTIDIHRRSGKAGKEEGVRYAAEARFELAQDTIMQLRAIRFGASDKAQAQAAAQIKTLRDRYINEMKEVIRYDYGPFIVAALASSGQMFDIIAQAFGRVPVPAGLSADEGKKFKELLQGQVNGFRAEAKGSYKAAVDKSAEIEIFTTWTTVARSGLAEHEAAPGGDVTEIPADARAADWMGL